MIQKQKRAEAQQEEEAQRKRKVPQSKDYTLYEKAESVKSIWEQLVLGHYQRDVGRITELPLQVVSKWLVKEGIAGDVEKAGLTITNEIGQLRQANENLITFEEFSRLFTKGVFKKAIVDVADRFGKMLKNSSS